MLSDRETLDIMLGGNCLEREGTEFSNSGRRPDGPTYNTLMNQDINSHSNSKGGEIRSCSQNGQNMRGNDSSSEFNRLSGELNQRITQKMGDFMSSVSSQIQRSIHEAINEQTLPQIQATLRSEQGQIPERRWKVPSRRPGYRSEEALDRRSRSSSRDELPRESN